MPPEEYLDHRNAANNFRQRIKAQGLLPAIGVYDVFSATIAARSFETIFLSGYGFCASMYGLPDEGFIAWPDMISFAERVRAVIPNHHIIVDIDDGYGDPLIAANVVQRLERVGASAIIMEDQVRPKKCGHLPGKEVLPIKDYMIRLRKVLDVRKHLFIVARTDSTDEDALERIKTYAEEGADAVMIDGLKDLSILKRIRETIPPHTHLVVNLITGGNTDPVTLAALKEANVNIVLFSTPCLFAAHAAVEKVLTDLKKNNGILSSNIETKKLSENNALLKENLNALLTWTDAGTPIPKKKY